MHDPLEIINFFYSPEDPAREILLLHSTQVRNKALFLSRGIPGIDLETVSTGAMLHDIGIDILHREVNPLIPESVLLYLYENDPCSSCRNRVFLSLMARYGDMTNLPEPLASIRKEAQLDCDYGTAMIARGQSIKRGE